MPRIAREHPRISVDPRVMVGKPCIKGTRIPVDLVLRHVAHRGIPEVLAGYPGLTEEDVRAAIAFAADVVANRTIVWNEA